MERTFDHLIIIGRPACGKSEFVDFMKKTPLAERMSKFHIGNIKELDDFLWLWEKFEEDDMWEKMGRPRIYSKGVEGSYVITKSEVLDLMFAKFNHEIKKNYLSHQEFYKDSTLFIEFSRGDKLDGGYRKALNMFSIEVLERAVILYINVSFEESVRRNTARYVEKLKYSILAHKVPEEDLRRFSESQDWESFTEGRESGKLTLNGIEVPFVTMNNVPELPPGPEIAKRYQAAMDKLV